MSIFKPEPAVFTELAGTLAFQYAVVDESKNLETGGATYVFLRVRLGLMTCESVTEFESTPNVESHVCQRDDSSVRPSGRIPGAGWASTGRIWPRPGCEAVLLSGTDEL